MSNSGSTVGLDSIIFTAVLTARPNRAPNHAAENDGLIALAEKLAASPDDVLQKLTETALILCHAQTAGISLLQSDGERFYWPALAGVWASHVGGSMPRLFSPCGTVLDRNAAQLMCHPELHFTYFAAVTPWIEEVLLIPFHVGAKAVGTIWVIVHDQSRRFDTEDLRVMTNLGTFASAAYQTLQAIKSVKVANERLESEVERRTSDLRHLSAQLLLAEDVERRRLALELHDGAGQWLVALKWKLGALTQQIPEPGGTLVDGLEDSLKLLDSLSQELRTVSHLLHPPLLEDAGLRVALEQYADGILERSGLAVELRIDPNLKRLSPDAERTVFRIVQEALTNVHRHAKTKSSVIQISTTSTGINFDVEDKGQGIPGFKSLDDPTTKLGVGIRGMQERARQLGGKFNLQSNPDGTRVSLFLPTQ